VRGQVVHERLLAVHGPDLGRVVVRAGRQQLACRAGARRSGTPLNWQYRLARM